MKDLNLMVEMKGISTPASKKDTDAQNLSTDPKESSGQATPDTAFDTSRRPWTPGPWRWNTHFTRLSQINERGVARVNIITDIEGLPSKADAHLIAAAPELYEALDLVDKWGTDPDGPIAWEVLAQVKAALAKARGEGVGK